jgi:thiol-disulfide isomerase/thioredoxin
MNLIFRVGKTLIFLVFAFCQLPNTHISAQGIEFFHGTWAEAKEKATNEGKILFVDAYAQWCGPCKRMASTVFTTSEAGSFYNSNFINVKMDMENGEGPKFAQTYPVSAYPTLMYIKPDGSVLMKEKGARDVQGLIDLGKNALGKFNNDDGIIKSYEAGDKSPESLLKYLKAQARKGGSGLKEANAYLATQKDLNSDINVSIITEAMTEVDSKIFDYYVGSRSKIESVLGKQVYLDRIEKAASNTVNKAVQFKAPSILEEAKSKMKKFYPAKAAQFAAKSDMQFAKSKVDDVAYSKAAKKFAPFVGSEPTKVFNFIATLQRDFPDKRNVSTLGESLALKAVAEAETIAKKDPEKFKPQDIVSFLYTTAILQKQNGKKAAALKTAEKAFKITIQEKLGNNHIVDLVNSIKSM